MELIPAIDILGGKVVRLHKGSYDEVTVFDENPADTAMRFEEQGATRLHVVDLDGARDGDPWPQNIRAIESIFGVTQLKVQVGGGIRSRSGAQRWLAAGAERVVFGTSAVKDPSLVQDLAADSPGAVIVALDARGDEVAVEGWLEGSGQKLSEMAKDVDGWGLAAVLHTNIERDGTRVGPDVAGTAKLQAMMKTLVIASGGVGTLAHLVELRDAGVRAAVAGRALLSGEFTYAEALKALGA